MLDDILMANSLHFFRNKEKVLRPCQHFLKTWRGFYTGRIQRGSK